MRRGLVDRQPDGGGPTRPILKWAGGKRQLLPQIRPFYPARFRTYFEPFVGSGAVFFDLHNRGHLEGRHAVLADCNPDLIGCLTAIRDQPEAVIEHLCRLAEERACDPRGHYYAVRDGRFNPLRERLALQDGELLPERYTPALAAMLIYLNRTGYNGLFRLNGRGAFNVPFGRYANPTICDAPNLRRVSRALARCHAGLHHRDFERVLDEAQAGDFVYLDPPYAPLSRTAAFTTYTPGGFGEHHQERLQQVVLELARRGCWVLLSNSTAPIITRLYDGNAEAARAGLRACRVPARRSINSDAASRGLVEEYLITNISERAREQ